MNYWLIKSEPFKYSFDQFLKDKKTFWDGVRNYEARNNLRAMKKGDLLLFYHSNEGKEVVVQPHKFKFAFVDGELTGSNPQGEHVVDALKSARLKSFGISTIPSINDSMVQHGAIVAAQKPTALTALVNHTLDLGKVTRSPAQVQLEMNSLTSRMLSPEMTPARKRADELVMKFIGE